MACEVCQHCQGWLIKEADIATRKGYSYHKRCHKCYVCSETNLLNADVFKGVIFCSSCSQRIFQGCSTARRSKNGKSKAIKPGAKRRERAAHLKKRASRARHHHVNGVLELTTLAASKESGSSTATGRTQKKRSNSSTSFTRPCRIEREQSVDEDLKDLKKMSAEIGVTTEVTQELLKQMHCPVVENDYCKNGPRSRPHKSPPKGKGDSRFNNTVICSDLRMAELGASTEIAHMALRKKSEVPVIVKSDLRELCSPSLSQLNQESDASGDVTDKSVDSTLSSKDRRQHNWLDRRLGSLIKMPYTFFKTNVVNRSSLISVVATDSVSRSFLKRLKVMFREETIEHQNRGVKRLYSTINRRRTPYKLGWLNIMARLSEDSGPTSTSMQKQECKRCKHFERSHSYRCMRAHVMRLAGPTKSELTCFRNAVIEKFKPPNFLKYIAGYNRKAIMKNEACGNDNYVVTHSLIRTQ